MSWLCPRLEYVSCATRAIVATRCTDLNTKRGASGESNEVVAGGESGRFVCIQDDTRNLGKGKAGEGQPEKAGGVASDVNLAPSLAEASTKTNPFPER